VGKIIKIKDALEARKNFYEFLSEVFLKSVPRKFIEDVKKGIFSVPKVKNKDIEAGFKEVFDYINKRSSNIEELLKEIADEYVRLFLGPVKAEVSPYQSTYEGNVIYGETTLRLRNIFRQAGLRISQKAGVGEDHLGIELKFMAYLCGRAVDERNVKEILELQRRFLEENMLPWVPKFCDDVIKSRGADFYRGMARVTKGFLKEDRALIYELIAWS
jgi:TorA maturation chaperone TorD